MTSQPGPDPSEPRLASESDVPNLAKARAAFWADQISKGSLDHPDTEPERLLADTRALIGRARTIIIVTMRGPVLGAYAIGQTKIPPGGAQISSIEEIYVNPQFRRCGLAQRLASHLVQNFQKHGVTRIQLRILENNGSAKTFWQSIGFVPSVVTYEYDN